MGDVKMEIQAELEFELRPPWERQLHESTAAYTAFRRYRDMGPSRNLLKAYRSIEGHTNAPTLTGSWKRWFVKYEWRDRARAWDEENGRMERSEQDAIRKKRLEQRLEVDATVHYPRIIALHRKIDEMIITPLATSEQVNKQTGLKNTLDRLAVATWMSDEVRQLELDYFQGCALPERAAAKEGAAEPVATIGRFEWVQDPDVPDPEPPALPKTDIQEEN